MAVSHRAITHLVAKALVAVAEETPDAACAALRLGGSAAELAELEAACEASARLRGAAHLSVRQLRGASALKKGGLAEEELLVGGTAWAMASEDLSGQLDVRASRWPHLSHASPLAALLRRRAIVAQHSHPLSPGARPGLSPPSPLCLRVQRRPRRLLLRPPQSLRSSRSSRSCRWLAGTLRR